MSKRVHELAKELDRTNKEVIAALAEKNVEVKSHMSVLSEEQEAMVPERKALPENRKEQLLLPQRRKKLLQYIMHITARRALKIPEATENREIVLSSPVLHREAHVRQETIRQNLQQEPAPRSPRHPASAQDLQEQRSSLQLPQLRIRHRIRQRKMAAGCSAVPSCTG